LFFDSVPVRSKSAIVPVVGVTGPIGSGKSTVSALFGEWGAVVVSGDKLGHQVLDSSLIRKKLADVFGGDILASGHVRRALLADRAFSTTEGVLALNSLVHPPLIRELNKQVKAAGARARTRAVVIDAALLVEWGMGKIHWDYLVGVSASYSVRVQRLRSRGLTIAQIRRFSAAQMPWQQKKSYCDFIVKNDATLSILKQRARLCWVKMLSSE
jgi:dephospho-CoA kinase